MFLNYLKAGYPCLWVQTHEEDRAIAQLSQEAEDYAIFSWDVVTGLKDHTADKVTQMPDPARAVVSIFTLPESSVLFLKDFHKFISAVEIFRQIKVIIPALKATDKHLVFISPVVNIPIELEKDITLLPFELPTVKELVAVAQKIVTENDLDIKVDEKVIAVAKGLTLHEAENAMALSLVMNKKISKAVLEQEKLQVIRKSGLMELCESVSETELGGLEPLKKYIRNRKKGFEDPKFPQPRGILLVGLPGAGKSLTAKVTANILDFPLIRLDVASLKGSLVGESEQKMRQALTIIDAISPCVVWLDELEKAIGGVQSSSRTDGGTTAAMFGLLLSWMQESKTKKYIVATSNDIEELLVLSQGALIRRFDDVFYVDLPTEQERRQILQIMNKKYKTNIDLDMARRMEYWTGAEIEKFVIASIYDGIDEAYANIKPVYMQNRDRIEKVREWAKHNARLANDSYNSEKPKRFIKLETDIRRGGVM